MIQQIIITESVVEIFFEKQKYSVQIPSKYLERIISDLTKKESAIHSIKLQSQK